VESRTRRQRETSSLAPAQIGGCKPRTLTGDCAQWLRERIASAPFTLRGLAAELADRGIKTIRGPCGCSFTPRVLSFKKPAAEEQIRPDMARKRARWKTNQSRIAPTRLVFH
jgi:transposase